MVLYCLILSLEIKFDKISWFCLSAYDVFPNLCSKRNGFTTRLYKVYINIKGKWKCARRCKLWKVMLMGQSQISCDASAMGKTREIWTKSWGRSHDFAPVGGALRRLRQCDCSTFIRIVQGFFIFYDDPRPKIIPDRSPTLWLGH